MVGKSITHKATGNIGIVTEYHPIPENSELTGIIVAMYPGTNGAVPFAQTYIESKPNGHCGNPGKTIQYEIVDCSNS